MAGNLALLLNGIGLAVTFTILLVTANTMSMAVRERRTEIAVLKTLGFSSGLVMALVLAEAAVLGVLGGGARDPAGLGHDPRASRPAVHRRCRQAFPEPGALAPRWAARLRPRASRWECWPGLVPAVGAYRARITDMLRTV